MEKEKVNVSVGIPVQVLSLARHGKGGISIETVPLTTDPVPDAVTREVRAAWNCEVYGHYGMTEMGWGAA